MQAQVSNFTQFNRYPRIFSRVSEFVKNPSCVNTRVLSFGCSTGEELSTLDDLYFSGVVLTGVDISAECVAKARQLSYTGKNKVEIYGPDDDSWKYKNYRVILALSVLCRWPDTIDMDSIESLYSFPEFEAQVRFLTDRLEPGGLLVVHNSSYYVEDTSVYKTTLRHVDLGIDYLGEVKKFDRKSRAYVNDRAGSNFFIKAF